MADGPVTDNYQGNKSQTTEILQAALATEIVCVLRYTALDHDRRHIERQRCRGVCGARER